MKVFIFSFFMIITSIYAEEEEKDGMITNSISKLIWQKCSIGQQNDNNCSGRAKLFTWNEAQSVCRVSKFQGKAWRLPKIKELIAHRDLSGGEAGMMINLKTYPNTYFYYWSSDIPSDQDIANIFGGNNPIAYYLDYSNLQHGESGFQTQKTKKYAVRCVTNL